MQHRFRRVTAGASLLLVTILAACGGEVSPSAAAPSPPPSAGGVVDAQARAAYSAAICPIFDRIVVIDPRLAALRTLGSDDGDVAGQAGEIDAVVDELGGVLTDLEAVPAWQPGGQLRFLLITALHDVRTRLIRIADDPTAPDAAEALAGTPFLASDAMDRAMSQAVEAGFVCLPSE